MKPRIEVRRHCPGVVVLLVCALVAAVRAEEPSPWELQVRRDATRLLAVCGNFGAFWAVGEQGAMLSSADGKLWSRRKSFTERALYGVSFTDATNGCVVGEMGAVAWTEDGGEHWVVAKPPVTEDLRAVSFGNRNVGMACGLKGTVLMTYDGGRTWLRKDVGYGESFFGAWMSSPAEGWIVGERGVILHTVDAGRTWTAERHPSGRWLYAVWFSGDTGWAVGRNGGILRYLLKKWEEIPLPAPTGPLYSVSGSGPQAVCVVGADGAVWTTPDAGTTWVKRETGGHEDLTAVALNGRVGWAVGTENSLLSSIDGGEGWATYSLESLPSYTEVSFADAGSGWTVGRSGLLWATRDGGKSWGQQDAGWRKDLTSVFAVTRNLCFAAGEGVIVKTDNGGLAWRRVWVEPPPSAAELEKPKAERKPPITLYDLHFFDARRGWAAGSDGTVMYTGNEGESWERLKTGIERSLFTLWFLSPNTGFAAGEDGQLYVTANGGRRWTPRAATGGGEALRSLFFIDADYGWAVGDGGTILRTTDAGLTWKEMRLGGALSLRDVWFIDRMQGWLVGERGTLLHTWDGGGSWVSDRPPVQTDYGGLMFVGPGQGWAVGDRGVILHTRAEAGR